MVMEGSLQTSDLKFSVCEHGDLNHYKTRYKDEIYFQMVCSWLQIQKSGFDSRHYKSFWEAVGLEQGPLILVSTIEELLERKSSGSGLESREYGHRDQSR
jgi:hypothetical protein